ncbi:hypothetical protein ACLB2K_060655 [Fragaria x ananassa]
MRSNLRNFDLADAWFDDETKIRENTGLLKKLILDNISEDLSTSCRLCSSDSNSSNISAASCGHPFCGDFWRGGACLMLRCPEPDCSAAVGPDLVQNATNQEAACYKKYKNYLLRSYIFQNHDLIQLCPAPDCNRAIRLDAGSNSGTTCNYVSCDCSRSYCWNCEEEEDHRPVDCETAGKWRREKPAEGNKYYDRYQKYYRRWQESGELEKKALEASIAWTVVYGYYNMRDVEEQNPKHNLFELLQYHAKVVCLERLESQVEQFLISAKLNDPSSASVVESNEFARVRVILQHLTITTMTCFKNLVRTLEEGFPELSCGDDDVEASWTCDRCTYVNAMSAVNCEICGTADTAEGECGVIGLVTGAPI